MTYNQPTKQLTLISCEMINFNLQENTDLFHSLQGAL